MISETIYKAGNNLFSFNSAHSEAGTQTKWGLEPDPGLRFAGLAPCTLLQRGSCSIGGFEDKSEKKLEHQIQKWFVDWLKTFILAT